MITLVKVLSFVVAAFALIGGFILLFFSDDSFMGIVFIAMGLLFMLIGFKYRGPNSNANIKQKSSVSTNVNLDLLDVNRIVMQVLESIDIAQTTKNIDTLISRLNFLNKVFRELLEAYNTKDYRSETLKTIDNYKQLYYDRELSENQLVAVTNPLGFKLDLFQSWSVYHCFKLNYEFQISEASKLKTERGKLGRYKKLQENLELTKSLIIGDFKSEVSQDLISRLNILETEIEVLNK
jgi:hypothetical protein